MENLLLRLRFLILFFSLFPLTVGAANSATGVKVTPLTSTVSLIEGAGGNITAFTGTGGVLLVDAGLAEMSDQLLAKLRDLKAGHPRFIVNTHFHFDHTGGNEVFGSTATMIAAKSVRARLEKEQTLWGKQHPPIPSQGLPILTYDQDLSLHINGEDVRVYHLPNGHTDGDSVVFFERNEVVSLGDLYLSGMYPIFHPEHGGSLHLLVQNLEWVLKQIRTGTKVVPGHGPLSTQAELARYLQMIHVSIKTVKNGIRQGFSLEEIQKVGLPKEWESFNHGYRTTDQWLASIYQDLKK